MPSQSPYYVSPLGGLDIGKRLLETGTQIKEERKTKALKEQAASVLQSGDPDAIAEFVQANPEMLDIVDKQIKFRDDITKKNAVDTALAVLQNESDPEEALQNRVDTVIERGGNPKHSLAMLNKIRTAKGQKTITNEGVPLDGLGIKDESNDTDFAREVTDESNDTDFAINVIDKPDLSFVKQEALQTLALLAPKKYKAYKDAITSGSKAGSVVGKLKQDLANGLINKDEYEAGLKKVTYTPGDNPSSSIGKLKADRKKGYINDEEFNLAISKMRKDAELKPASTIGKLKDDFAKGFIGPEEYDKAAAKILNPSGRTKADLTAAALAGDDKAKNILDAMMAATVMETQAKSQAATTGKMEGLSKYVDVEGVARRIVAGQEIIDNVKNTFGVPLQELVRKRVLELAPGYNFNQPRALYNGLKGSVAQQEKRIGSMGGFITNLNDQINYVQEKFKELDRLGIRGLDKPKREILNSVIGSGKEKAVELILTEISNEATKLSQSATESIAQLSDSARIHWEKIHDPALPLNEINTILQTTRDAAKMRMEAAYTQRDKTMKRLENVRPMSLPVTTGPNDPAFIQLQSGEQFIYNGQVMTKK